MNSAASPAAQIRDTAYGPVAGVDDASKSGTYFWKGIPFAKPPLGDLRWRAPVKPDVWSGPLATRTFGPACSQLGWIHGPGLHNAYDATIASSLAQPVGSEDCLYLNIWRPATDETDLPVIFFIYGGAKISGYAADPVYDGATLANAANAVVVTAGYRLGLLGWFDLPQLKTGTDPQEDSGNFGTLDQIQILRFIQRDIANFGGDPGNVTLMGQSAGAADVCALVTSPVVVGAVPSLIHRAVMMSGGLALPSELPPGCIPLLRPTAYTRKQGTALLHALLITDGLATDDAAAAAYVGERTDAEVAAYLRSREPGDLSRLMLTHLLPAGLGQISHIPDGTVVADSPLAAIRAGQYLKVPMIISATRDEAKLFPAFLALSPALGGAPGLVINDTKRFEWMMAFDGDAAQTLAEPDLIHPAYLPVDAPVTGYEARMALLNQVFLSANRDALLKALAAGQTNLWYYRFDWDEEPAPWNVVYGAAHLFDTYFMFGNFGPSVFSNVINSKANQGGRLALSKAMMGALGAFARNGDPNHAALDVAWPAWPGTLVFDATSTDREISVSSG